MKKIISYSLFGNNDLYTHGSIKNAEISKTLYPDWIVRIYYDKTVPFNIIDSLSLFDNVELRFMLNRNKYQKFFWRFYPASEPDVSIMLSRDCDARLTEREKCAVDEWLNSDKDFHIMRDNKAHSTKILAGMFGCRNGIMKDMDVLVKNYFKNNKLFFGSDQKFLREVVYDKIVDNSFIHDEYHKFETFSKKFPTERIGVDFVGRTYPSGTGLDKKKER